MAKKEIDGVTVETSNILTALKIIKEVCEDNTDCEKCPMCSDKGVCLVLNDYPTNWEINETNEPWRALLP